jgi:hypothetical protein
MNFKHEKFDDSAVMRSLEKVAREKGWVEVKPITKSASNELNLSPSPNLVDNVMKLCAGLRQAGLERYALDVENKFVAFKQAATLYDTHGETGDDLIDAAHPKGSHKMEGLDNAVFKTILDRHVDMINMIDKKPSGKLSTSEEVISAVKKALGAPSNNANGSALKNVLGQDKPAESGGGVVTDVAVSAGSMILMQKAFNIVKNWKAGGVVKAYDVSLVQLAKSQATSDAAKKALETGLKGPDAARILAKMTPTATAALEKEVVKDVAAAAAKSTASSVAGAAGKAVIPELGKAGLSAAERAAQTAAGGAAQTAGGAAVKSSGIWSRLFGAASTAGSAASAVGSTTIGGGTLTGGTAGLAGMGVAGAASLAAAALVGAAAGSYIGYQLFEHYYNVTDLKEAGERLMSESKDVESDFPEYKHVTNFQRTLNQIVAKYPIISKLKSGETLTGEDLVAMSEIHDLINQSNKQAQTIWGYAMGHKDDQWLGALRGFGDVVASAKNYMEVSMKMSDAFEEFARGAMNAVAQKTKQQSAPPPGSSVDTQKVLQGFDDTMKTVELYKNRVTALELKNAIALNKWLDGVADYITKNKAKLDSNTSKSDQVVLSAAQKKLDSAKSALDGFKKKWLS